MNNIQICYSDWKRMQEELNNIRLEREIDIEEIQKMRQQLINKYGEEIFKFVEDFAR